MKFDNREPCKTCPYRKDVPIGTWHKSEFTSLLAHDADPVYGHQFGCHQYRKRPVAEHRPCVGWLLDQRRRNVPSMQLRLTLITKKAASKQFKEISDGGHEIYDSIEEMARVNIPARRQRRGARR